MPGHIIAEIVGNQFPVLSIPPDTYVSWRNLDPYPHTVETAPKDPNFFNVGPLFPGAVSSPVYFRGIVSVEYVCRFHANMSGRVVVDPSARLPDSGVARPERDQKHNGDHDHRFEHFHGFVTGGRTPDRLFMTHTPVIADERHCYQVILKGSFVESKHASAYAAIRNGDYGDGVVQTFHDHIALPDIASGKVKVLPESNLVIYPDGGSTDAPGLEEKVPIRIEQVLHFHTFEPDAPYPAGMAYLIYGDADDVFIDHHITRAPSFHSVAKLAVPPAFWNAKMHATATPALLTSKRIVDVSPQVLPRTAFVDNAFHLFWLPPSGVISPAPQDPLIPRDGGSTSYEVTLPDGSNGKIEIGRFLYFDIRLLNNRVVIT